MGLYLIQLAKKSYPPPQLRVIYEVLCIVAMLVSSGIIGISGRVRVRVSVRVRVRGGGGSVNLANINREGRT